MTNVLVVQEDVKQNQIVCTYLSDSRFNAKGVLNINSAYEEMYNDILYNQNK